MSENTILTLYVSTVAVLGTWNIMLTLLWWSLRSDVKETNLALRLFSKGMGRAAAEIIHRDDDLWGIDRILDKYKLNHDLTLEEWIKIRDVMNMLKEDTNIPHGTKMAIAVVSFEMLGELARHKIYGKDPRVMKAVKEVIGDK